MVIELHPVGETVFEKVRPPQSEGRGVVLLLNGKSTLVTVPVLGVRVRVIEFVSVPPALIAPINGLRVLPGGLGVEAILGEVRALEREFSVKDV